MDIRALMEGHGQAAPFVIMRFYALLGEPNRGGSLWMTQEGFRCSAGTTVDRQTRPRPPVGASMTMSSQIGSHDRECDRQKVPRAGRRMIFLATDTGHLGQHHVTRMTLDQGRDIAVVRPGQQIAFPMARHRPIFNRRRSLTDYRRYP